MRPYEESLKSYESNRISVASSTEIKRGKRRLQLEAEAKGVNHTGRLGSFGQPQGAFVGV